MNRYAQVTRTQLEQGIEAARKELAKFEAQRSRVEREFQATLDDPHRKLVPLQNDLGQMVSELSRREARDNVVPDITDHALLRYMERIHGIDVDALKAELLTDQLQEAIRSGACKFKTAEGDFVIKGASVVTFLTPEKPGTAKKLTRAQSEAMEAV